MASDIEQEQSEFLEKALSEGTMPDWMILAAIGPKKLSEKGRLLVRLNMRQQGIRPTKGKR